MAIEAVLSIWIKGKKVSQGKIFKGIDRWIYLADINGNKLFRNYNGYAISHQILESFSKLKIKPLILYRYREMGTVYQTIPSRFKSKGIMVPYGDHRQYVLPIKNWDIYRNPLNDPHGLPEMDVSEWISKSNPSIIEDVSIPTDVMFKLKDMVKNKPWYRKMKAKYA